jgi:SAM-dependent methyltransferase
MLEPACGGGAFLQGAARRLRRTRPEEDAARAARAALHGVDRDPVALRLAARGLWLRLSEPGAAFDLPAGRLVRADTLLAPETPACAWPSGTAANAAVLGLGFRDVAARGGFDLVVGNPPYDVLTNFGTHPDARATAEALRASKRFPLSTTGQINLYRCFIERALRLLRPGGTLVFVVPSGLLLDRAATAIRRALVEQHAADLFRLSGEKARAFPGVTQAVVVFRCRRDAGQAGSIRVVETDRASTVRPADLRALGRDLPCPAGSETDWALARWLVRNAPRRFDTLADGWVGEVDQTVYRRFMSNAPTGTRLARGAHCTPFRLDLSGGASAPAWLEREGFLRRKGSAARACLERTRRERVAQLGIRNLASVPRLVAARVPPEVFLGNSLNVWIPQSGVPLLFLLGLLNASLLDWRFRFTSGNNNINLCEIATLPLPTRLPDAAVRRVARAAADCEDAAAEPDAAAFLETRTRLDRAVGDLYHLPDEFRRHLAAPGRPD